MAAQVLFEDARDRAMTFLLRLHEEAPETPNAEVAEAFAQEFAGDGEVVEWALHALAIKLWGEIKPAAGIHPTNRRSVRRVRGERVVQLRVEWYDVRDPAEITQMIVESTRQTQGHAMRVRDLNKVRDAMRAFPGVTAGEAARLAGVKLEVLGYEEQAA